MHHINRCVKFDRMIPKIFFETSGFILADDMAGKLTGALWYKV